MSWCGVLLGSGRGCLWVCMCSGLIRCVFRGWNVLLENFNPEIWPSPSQRVLFLFYKLFMEISSFIRDSLTKASFYGFTYGVAQCANYFINAAVFRFGAWLIAHCLSNFENVFMWVYFIKCKKKKNNAWDSDFNVCKLFHQITDVMGHGDSEIQSGWECSLGRRTF